MLSSAVPRAFFPHLVSSCLHSWSLNPLHPASTLPSSLQLPTHAKSQQKNVEQDLDTSHSSFHRHGCWTWGRGEGRGIRTGRGSPRFPGSGTALEAFPARPPFPAPPTRKPAVRSTSPSPLFSQAREGWGRLPRSPGLPAASGDRSEGASRGAGPPPTLGRQPQALNTPFPPDQSRKRSSARA